MGNKPNNTNILRCRVFDVRDPFEIAGSLGQVFSNGGQSLDNLVARVICEKTSLFKCDKPNTNRFDVEAALGYPRASFQTYTGFGGKWALQTNSIFLLSMCEHLPGYYFGLRL